MFERGVEHRRERVFLRILVELLRIDGTGVDADADRAAVRAGDVDEIRDLGADRLLALDVVEVPRVVAELLHERRDAFGQAVIFLQVDDEVGVRPRGADFGERGDVFRRVDGDADDVRAGGFEELDLADRRGDVLRFRGRHRLHGDGVTGADGDVADPHLTGNSLFHRAL